MIKLKLYTENDLEKNNRVGSTKYLKQLLSFFKGQDNIEISYNLLMPPNTTLLKKIQSLYSLIFKNIPVQIFLRGYMEYEMSIDKNEYILVDSIYLAPFVKNKERTILLAQDSISRLQMSIANSKTKWYQRLYYSLSSIAYLKLETQLYKKFKKVYFVSDLDRQYIEAQVQYHNFGVLEIGLDENELYLSNDSHLEEQIKERYGNYIIFTGNMSYPPNQDAANILLHHVFPSIKRDNPDVKLLFAGLYSEKFNYPEKDIFGLGQVESIKEFISCSIVYVSPLISGSGMKNKVLEALSQNTILVASSKSIEGIKNLKDNEHFMLADSSEEFIEKINKVLQNPNKYQILKEQGFKYIMEFHLFKEKNKKVLEDLFKEGY